MIKVDLVKRVAQHLNLKDTEAQAVVDAIIEGLKETICEHERLEIRDFGVFQTKMRKPRIGRNPRDRKEYPIPPRRVVTFKLGKELKEFAFGGGEIVEAPGGDDVDDRPSGPFPPKPAAIEED
jgi:nucleoid DNA-binding protein